MEHSLCVFSSGTTHENFPFVFAIQVQQDIAGHESFFKCFCSGQTCFFVNSEQAFYRSVLDIVGSQDGEFGSYTDAVVGTQCRSVGTQPVTVDDCFDRIVVEVVDCSVVFFTNHIHMRLQDNDRQVFISGRCRFRHQDISGCIFFQDDFILFSERFQILDHFAFLL